MIDAWTSSARFPRWTALVVGLATVVIAFAVVSFTQRPDDAAPVRSFPGAEGYGADATGGRGGQIVKVTTSADDGPGSLRWALEDVDGPRTVVFEVNEVNLTGRNIQLTDGDVTIAGQSAGGVQVTGATITIRADNVIMRGMMFRPGDSTAGHDPGDRDGLKFYKPGGTVSDVMVDHCSFMWATDENVAFFRDVRDVTISNSIIAQGLRDSINPSGPTSYGMLFDSGSSETEYPQRITVTDNLFAYNYGRNPWIKQGQQIEFVNNYVFAPGEMYRSIAIGNNESDGYSHSLYTSANITANYYQSGPETSEKRYDPPIRIVNLADGEYRIADNLVFDKNGNQLTQHYHGYKGVNLDDVVETSSFSSGIDIAPAATVPDHVLANAGANPLDRDEAEQRIIDAVTAQTGGLVDSVKEAGGWPERTFQAPADADNDGMPDWFEDAYGFDKTRFDANGDSDGDGYTNIEEYLNGFYAGFDLPKAVEPAPAEPAPEPEPATDGPEPFRFEDGMLSIDASDYDEGGEGLGYHDTTPGLDSGASDGGRQGTDVEQTSLGDIGYVADGEWLQYTIEVDRAGTYDLSATMSAKHSGRSVSFDFFRPGEATPYASSAPIENPDADSYRAFAAYGGESVFLQAGVQIVRVTLNGGDQALRSFELSAVEPAPAEPAPEPSDLLIYLVDTDTDTIVAEIHDGAEIDRSLLEGRNIGLGVELASGGRFGGEVGSIALDFENGAATAVENYAPYALFGDNNGDFRGGTDFEAGAYDFAIDVFSDPNGAGVRLLEMDLTFSVLDAV